MNTSLLSNSCWKQFTIRTDYSTDEDICGYQRGDILGLFDRDRSWLICKIMPIKEPRTKKQIRSLLGLVNLYSYFIPRYSYIVACLTDLMSSKTAGNAIWWSLQHIIAVHELQRALNSRPFFRIPNLSNEFFLSLLTLLRFVSAAVWLKSMKGKPTHQIYEQETHPCGAETGCARPEGCCCLLGC